MLSGSFRPFKFIGIVNELFEDLKKLQCFRTFGTPGLAAFRIQGYEIFQHLEQFSLFLRIANSPSDQNFLTLLAIVWNFTFSNNKVNFSRVLSYLFIIFFFRERLRQLLIFSFRSLLVIFEPWSKFLQFRIFLLDS